MRETGESRAVSIAVKVICGMIEVVALSIGAVVAVILVIAYMVGWLAEWFAQKIKGKGAES